MQYKDDIANGYVNGNYVGVRSGSPSPDALEPTSDGYEVPRNTKRIGTVTQDGLEPNYPEPL